MKDRKNYVAPEAEVHEMAVEQGFIESKEPQFTGFGTESDWE